MAILPEEAPMNCPKCAETSLAAKKVNFLLEVDHCPECEGVWFDQQEIYARVKSPARFFEHFKEAYQTAKETEFTCPRDGKKMIQAVFEKAALPFEACQHCGGMWFDKGEVEKLNSFLEQWQAS